ncbi:MAG: nuclear transport factor 2 family protein [Bryobacteraceae bacterium]
MAIETARHFLRALERLESERRLDEIVSLFTDDCEVGNSLAPGKFHGREGAREFWRKYRDTFAHIRSTFRNRIVTENRAALEWITEASTSGGDTIYYEGVSILETNEDGITRFCAYFDPTHLREYFRHGRKERARQEPVLVGPTA